MPRKKISEEDSQPILTRTRRKKADDSEAKAEDKNKAENKPTRAKKDVEKDKEPNVKEKAPKSPENASGEESKPVVIEEKAQANKPSNRVARPKSDSPIIERAPKKMGITQEIPGKKSEEIVLAEAREIPAYSNSDEKEVATLEDLKASLSNKEILWGEVYGIDDGVGVMDGHVVFSVLYNGIRIQIPDNLFFEKTYSFGRDYDALPEDGPGERPSKYRRRKERGQFYNGARVCFVIKAVARDKIEDGYYAGEYEPNVYASRTEAMEMLREIYFGDNSDMFVEVGNIAIANVLGVRPDRIRVECLGVETSIDAHNINEENAENCEDYFRTGDKMKVRIRKLHRNGNNDVYLTVSGRMNDANKMINSMFIGSSYIGVVDKFNRKNNTYSITLKNGVPASVKQNMVRGGEKLVRGDRVSVRVTEIKNTFVIGLALKY